MGKKTTDLDMLDPSLPSDIFTDDQGMKFASKTICEVLDGIAGAKGGDKTKQMTQFAKMGAPRDVEFFKRFLKLTYDDFIRFGISHDHPRVREAYNGKSGKLDLDNRFFNSVESLTTTRGSGDKVAIITTLFSEYDTYCGRLLIRILMKDARCNIAGSTVSKVFKDLLTEFDVQLASPFTLKAVRSWPVAVEQKYDGMRAVTRVDLENGIVDFYTRSGRPIPAMINFTDMMMTLARTLDRGEVVFFDGEVIGGGNFNESISSTRSSEPMTAGTYHVFDLMAEDFISSATGEGTLQTFGTQAQRRTWLEKILPEPYTNIGPGSWSLKVELPASYAANSVEEVEQIYMQARNAGMEGLIVKQLDGTYEKKRSKNWLKLKAEETADLVVVGAFEGQGMFEGTLGGLIVDHKGVEVEVGSGFTIKQRNEIWPMWLADKATHEAGGQRFQILSTQIEVQYQEVTPAGSLRHPVFVRLRGDKVKHAGAF